MRPHGLQPARLLCPWNYPGKNTGVGCHFLLNGIFLIQGSNPCLLHWQVGSLPLHHLESPIIHLPGIKPTPPALESQSLFVVVVLFIFGCSRSSLLCAGFLYVRWLGATLHCRALAFHCGGFACCRAQSLWLPDSRAWAQ